MTAIHEVPRILADTGPFCRLAEAGEVHLDVAAAYLQANVEVVDDVSRELRRRSTIAVHARLTRLTQLGVPAGDPVTVTDRHLLDRIDTIVDGRRRRKPGHELEDRGEVATALVAAALGVPALMDDGSARHWLRARACRCTRRRTSPSSWPPATCSSPSTRTGSTASSTRTAPEPSSISSSPLGRSREAARSGVLRRPFGGPGRGQAPDRHSPPQRADSPSGARHSHPAKPPDDLERRSRSSRSRT